MLWRVILAGIAGLFVLPQCLAADWSEHWTATSNTASAITGDVTLRTAQIDFARGQSLPFERLKNVVFTDDIGTVGPATVYRITKPADPVLLGGNRICGGPKAAVPVTFIVIWRTKPIVPAEGAARAFAAYAGQNESAPTVDETCGIFRYDLRK